MLDNIFCHSLKCFANEEMTLMKVELVFRSKRRIVLDCVEDLQDTSSVLRVMRQNEARIYPLDLLEEVIFSMNK